MSRVLEQLKQLAEIPRQDAGPWLASAESGVEFLKEHLRSDTTVLYASLNAVMIHGVLVPLKHIDPADRKKLSHEFILPDDSWIIEHSSGGGQPDCVYLAPPLRRLGKPLDEGEKLVFKRSFAGRRRDTPVEISQKLVHALDLHFIDERNAWCRLDEDGDLVDVITVVRENIESWTQNVTVVTILTEDFAEYMRLASMGMVIFFDFTRTRLGSFNGWYDVTPIEFDAPDLFYHGGVMGEQGSHINGRMIVRPAVSYDEIVKAHMEMRDPTKRQYAMFKAIDLKTNERIEVSADPDGFSNYFQPESTLPLEMSPAFFKAEVLHRYKADPVKYDLGDRTISCRGAWSLRTYDINKEGQVHTYLCYLGELPYKEQLYWQSFNEWPKGGLSERAITTDFRGEFYDGGDALDALKRLILQLDENPPSWWQTRGENLRKSVRYPATSSAAEWGDEILALDQLVNEGFLPGQLRQLARTLGVKPQADWRAFKLLEECLTAKSSDQVDAKSVMDAFRRLRDLRNHLKGHSSERKQALEKEAIMKFRSFRAQFENIAAEIHEALKLIAKSLASIEDH
jgi:hypothetical protein